MAEMFTAPIAEWDDSKQYGFLNLGRRRIFLHIKDFAVRGKQPKIGDVIHFAIGSDSQGRTCAIQAVHFGLSTRRSVSSSRDNGLRLDDLVLLIFLLIAPVWAIYRLALPPAVTLISAVALSAITFLTYVLDKMRAQARDWRIPENTLHFLALIGGWPGAFLGQQHVRHKTAKISFQITFWFIVFIWQFVAIDFLLQWKISLFVWSKTINLQ